MSLNCLLLKPCGGKNHKKHPSDDRPFPEEDDQVFPIENMYDRIILPGKINYMENSKLNIKRTISFGESNNNIRTLWDAQVTKISTYEGKIIRYIFFKEFFNEN